MGKAKDCSLLRLAEAQRLRAALSPFVRCERLNPAVKTLALHGMS